MSQSFDNKAREQLSAHQPEVDFTAIWGAIEPGVDALNAKRRKRRLLAWWFFSLAGLSMAAVLLWWLSPEQPATPTDAPVPQATAPLVESTPPSEQEEVSIDQGTAKTSQPQRASNDRPPVPPASANATALQKAASDAQNQLIKSEQTPANQQMEAIVIQEVPTPATDLPLAIAPETREFAALASLPILSAYLELPTTKLPTLADYALSDAQPLSPPKSKAFQWSIGLQGGASTALRQLSADEQDAQALLELRQRTEQSLEVLHAGLRLGATHRSGFGLYTGAQWTRIAERMEFRDQLVQHDSVYGIQALAVNPFGDTTAIYWQVPHTTTTSINKRYYNYYQFLDIPLFVGYQRQVGSWILGTEAGVYLNLRLRSSGQVLQADYSGLDLAGAQPELLPNRLGLSYHLGLRASRELWPGVQLSLSPQWRYLPNISTDANPIKQRYSLLGMQVGLSYEF